MDRAPRRRRHPIGSRALALALIVGSLVAAAGCATPTATATAPPTVPAVRTPAPPAPSRTSAGPVEPSGFGLAPIGRTESARVVRIVDGDTIVVDRGRGPEKLRYIGMDTPETKAPGQPVEWMGPEASAANAALVAGRPVVLERDVSETDRYGRLLRYVWVADRSSRSGWAMVDLRLVEEGFAQVATFPPDVRYVELFLAGERRARAAGVGLWGPHS